MPCTFHETDEDRRRSLEAGPVIARQKGLLDEATRAACEALTFIEKSHKPVTKGTGISKQTGTWWADHKKRDVARLEQEAEQQQAALRDELGKLLKSTNAKKIPARKLKSAINSLKKVDQ